MTDDRSIERAARAWLEEGPTRAPDRSVELALARIQTTTQDRNRLVVPRLPTMSVRFAAASALALLVLGLALTFTPMGGPGGRPSATPAISAFAPHELVRYASEAFPYTIEVPKSWSARAAVPCCDTTDFSLRGYGSVGASVDWLAPSTTATLYDAGYTSIAVWAHKETGSPLDGLSPSPGACQAGSDPCRESVWIGGQPGYVDWVVDQHDAFGRAFTAHGGWWFRFSEIGLSHPYFLELLSTVEFTNN